MGISSTTIWDCRPTVGSDNNGGLFDPGQTSGMNTDGAATSATGSSPVFTSASYNFVSGDVGSWLYISSGTNWIPGFYQIASVASNAATLLASAGSAYSWQVGQFTVLSSVAGCATTASPTSATWTIDRSQQNSAFKNFTDLAGASGNKVSSASYTFVKSDVGNGLHITAGTSVNTGYYIITAVSSGSAVLDRDPGSSGTGGSYYVGGALATMLSSITDHGNDWPVQSGNIFAIKATGTLTVTASTYLSQRSYLTMMGYTNTRGDGTVGCAEVTTSTNSLPMFYIGYGGTSSSNFQWLYFKSTASTKADCFYTDGSTPAHSMWNGCVFDGFQSGVNMSSDDSGGSGFNSMFTNCEFKNCTIAGLWMADNTIVQSCYFHGNGVGYQIQAAHSGLHVFTRCVFASNSYGIYAQYFASKTAVLENCAFWDNTNDGAQFINGASGANNGLFVTSCIFYGNGGYGINSNAEINSLLRNNAFGSNTSGKRGSGYLQGSETDIILTADPFTSGSTGDFSLNSTSGGGPLCKGTGYPGTIG